MVRELIQPDPNTIEVQLVFSLFYERVTLYQYMFTNDKCNTSGL